MTPTQEYELFINKAVETVQKGLGSGNIQNEEALQQAISEETAFNDADKAFHFFRVHSPHRWKDFVTSEYMEAQDFDLGVAATSVCNMAVYNDVMEQIQITRAFDRISGSEPDCWALSSDYRGAITHFSESWKWKALPFDNLAQVEKYDHGGREITAYQEGDDLPVFTATHEDPALVWISKNTFPVDALTMREYQYLYEGMLRHFGFKQDVLWLCTCQTSKEFTDYWGDDYGLEQYSYVVYWTESSSIMQHKGFNNFIEFTKACQFVAENS